MSNNSSPSDPILAKLDDIALHLEHIDRRDRMRMIGSTIRGLINMGFLVFVVWSSVYLLQHMDEIVKTMTEQAAKQSQQMMKGGSEDFLKHVQQMLK